MEIRDIAAKGPSPFGDRNDAPLGAIFTGVQRVLNDGRAAPIGTGELVRLLLPGADANEVKNLIAWLQALRKLVIADDWYDRGKPMPGTFGKPSIRWRKPTTQK